MSAKGNHAARIKAIRNAGLAHDYAKFIVEHDGIGMNRFCLSNQYCLTRNIDWRKYLK